MNPANLPFDSEAMLQGLGGWVECESPTFDATAVERMLDIAARDMAIMGATIERIAGRWSLSRYSPDSDTWTRVGSYPSRIAAVSAAYGEENQR